ncbi:MAG TPA: type II toxin-antitoxin system VapC family toxin [Vicinamibacterales bacterium]|jgi:ribonuclease VapC|nr:type II toxin-antitoxin system VapC family toxin [Acidobacteriota bacterium]HQX80773.1 type II toxin-antitoxin system VapC family toxin [Vicinamibacterales bacterium]
MTLDSSALIAILFAEPGYLALVDRILEADHVRVGAPTMVETSLVFAGRKGARSAESVEGLVRELSVTIVPFGEAEWRVAADAFRRFGRGRHSAALNYGDCLAYATAQTARDTLLFVGEDFSKTDISPA